MFGQTCGGIDPSALGGECASSDSFGDSDGSGGFDEFDDSGGSSFDSSPFASSPVDDKSWQIGGMSAAIAVIYLGGLALLDRRGLRGLATAFVLPGVLALATGVSALGDASNHAWIGGILALAAGVGLGLIGQGTQRRFTAWTGGVVRGRGCPHDRARHREPRHHCNRRRRVLERQDRRPRHDRRRMRAGVDRPGGAARVPPSRPRDAVPPPTPAEPPGPRSEEPAPSPTPMFEDVPMPVPPSSWAPEPAPPSQPSPEPPSAPPTAPGWASPPVRPDDVPRPPDPWDPPSE